MERVERMMWDERRVVGWIVWIFGVSFDVDGDDACSLAIPVGLKSED